MKYDAEFGKKEDRTSLRKHEETREFKNATLHRYFHLGNLF